MISSLEHGPPAALQSNTLQPGVQLKHDDSVGLMGVLHTFLRNVYGGSRWCALESLIVHLLSL